MNFKIKEESNFYKIGKTIGLYCGFLIFFSAVYFIFLRNNFSYFYVIITALIAGSILIYREKFIKHGKHKITF